MLFEKNGKKIDFRGAIFDLDGTLLESMHIWETLGARFLISKNRKPENDLRAKMSKMSLRKSSEYFCLNYSLDMTPEEVYNEMIAILEEQYFGILQLKPGAAEFVKSLKEHGVKLAIVTATDRHLSETALIRTGIRKYFDVFMTTKEFGKGKSCPDIFYSACDALGCDKNNVVIFEDAAYALKTAHENGFLAAAVYDYHSREKTEEIKANSDWYIESYYNAILPEAPKQTVSFSYFESAGNDGIISDCKVFTAFGTYGSAVISYSNGAGRKKTSGADFKKQSAFVFSSYPDGVKIGALYDIKQLEAIVLLLERNKFIKSVFSFSELYPVLKDQPVNYVTGILKNADIISADIKHITEFNASNSLKNIDDEIISFYNKINKPLFVYNITGDFAAGFALCDNGAVSHFDTGIKEFNFKCTDSVVSSSLLCSLSKGETIRTSAVKAAEYLSSLYKQTNGAGSNGNTPYYTFNINGFGGRL